MKERPILFSGPMVRAILDGRKTQTRRICKSQPYSNGFHFDGHDILCHNDYLPPGAMLMDCKGYTTSNLEGWTAECPYGQPGDRLWVREAHAIVPRTAYRCSEGVSQTLRPDDDHDAAIYREGWTRSRSGFRWRPSIHMPRWASRILLEIVSVRVERLQGISEADAIAEGVERVVVGEGWRRYCDPDMEEAGVPPVRYARHSFATLWDHINGPGEWEDNPWVWVVEFRRAEE